MDVQVLRTREEINDFVTNSWRPLVKDGKVLVPDGIRANAFLNQEEWERLDKAVIARGKQRLNAWADVMNAGLVSRTTLAEEYSKWRVASERIAAEVSMDFRTQHGEDRTDKKTYGVPIPIVSAAFSIGRRELMVARAAGSDIETFEAEEAGAAVAEKLEDMLINGETGVVVQGNDIPGFTTLAARYQGTAEGDFGTISNIYTTFLAAVTQAASERYYGPFNVYIANTQYHEMLEYYSDGTGQTPLQRVEAMPQIRSVKPNDLMTAGEFVMVQMTREVVDIREAMAMENRRWVSPDESRIHFMVMAAAVPRVKTDYAGEAGVYHYSSC
jgi:uncharacterized linocin/CFP29 family protein